MLPHGLDTLVSWRSNGISRNGTLMRLMLKNQMSSVPTLAYLTVCANRAKTYNRIRLILRKNRLLFLSHMPAAVSTIAAEWPLVIDVCHGDGFPHQDSPQRDLSAVNYVHADELSTARAIGSSRCLPGCRSAHVTRAMRRAACRNASEIVSQNVKASDNRSLRQCA